MEGKGKDIGTKLKGNKKENGDETKGIWKIKQYRELNRKENGNGKERKRRKGKRRVKEKERERKEN